MTRQRETPPIEEAATFHNTFLAVYQQRDLLGVARYDRSAKDVSFLPFSFVSLTASIILSQCTGALPPRASTPSTGHNEYIKLNRILPK
jgi:hypothetical protein